MASLVEGFIRLSWTVFRICRYQLPWKAPLMPTLEETLKPGDHIVVLRVFCDIILYAHHAIYVGDGMVTQFGPATESLKATMTGFVASSRRREGLCNVCGPHVDHRGVSKICLECFLHEAQQFTWGLYEYSANCSTYITSMCVCTTAKSDPAEEVIHRAKYLLEHGFGPYNFHENNCENFATYCKTGLVEKRGLGKNALFAGWSLQTQGKRYTSLVLDSISLVKREMKKVPVEQLARYMHWDDSEQQGDG